MTHSIQTAHHVLRTTHCAQFTYPHPTSYNLITATRHLPRTTYNSLLSHTPPPTSHTLFTIHYAPPPHGLSEQRVGKLQLASRDRCSCRQRRGRRVPRRPSYLSPTQASSALPARLPPASSCSAASSSRTRSPGMVSFSSSSAAIACMAWSCSSRILRVRA